MQLIDGNSGNVLWSTRLVNGAGAAEFSADALPVAAAAQFAEQIMQREQARAMAKRAPFSAWDHIFRSAANSVRADQASTRQAVVEAQLAVAAAPDIGLAHALLASALAAVPECQGLKPDAEQIREIQTESRKAMRLDGNNPSVLMALAGAYKGLGEYDICLRLAKRTVELWPSSPQSYLILANSYRLLGRTAEAVTAYRRQEQISPFDSNRNVALTCLAECLLAEDQPEAAEEAIDRALMLDPEYPAALEWKAIIADKLGKERAALNVMRQIHSADEAVLLGQHVWQIERDEHLRDRIAAHVATLQRLWVAVESPAAAPAALPEPAEAAAPVSQETVAEPVALAVPPAAEIALTQAPTIVLEPVVAAAVVALDSGGSVEVPVPTDNPSAEPSAIPLKDGKPPAGKRARGKPPEAEPAPAPRDEYLISPALPDPKPAKQPKPAANDGALPVGAGRKFAVPRVAVLAGAIALAGAGGAVWFSSGSPDKTEVTAPAVVPADLGLAAPSETTTDAATVSGASQPLVGALSALISASRNAGRPQAELAALEAGQQKLAGLLAQSAADPANTALTAQINGLAAALARQQGAALSGDGDRWLKNQEQTAAAAKRQMTPEGAAIVDRALNRARGARSELAAAVGASGRASDAASSLGAARAAVIAYSRLGGSSVAPAIASARSAAADTDRLKERLARAHVEIETARGDVGRLAGQVAGLATAEKPGLFASGTKRQSFKLRKDNAERARALAAEADRLAASSASVSDAGELAAVLARVRNLKSQVATLLAASNAALKAAAKPDDKTKAPDSKTNVPGKK